MSSSTIVAISANRLLGRYNGLGVNRAEFTGDGFLWESPLSGWKTTISGV